MRRGRHGNATEEAAGGHQFSRDVAQLASDVFGDDEDPAHVRLSRTMTAIRWAAAAGSVGSISARWPRTGADRRRTLKPEAGRIVGTCTSMGICSACLIARRLTYRVPCVAC